MTEETERRTPPESEPDAAGVLANLPHTRPQRSSARRIAARNGATRAGAPRKSTRSGEEKQPSPATSPSSATPGKRARKPQSGARKSAARADSRARAQSAPSSRPPRRATSATAGANAKRAPRQGFESETDATTGPVTPPGGAELLNAATELLGEVAKSGLSRGVSTVKDVLGRLRLF